VTDADLAQSSNLSLILFFAFVAFVFVVYVVVRIVDHLAEARSRRWLRRVRSERITRHRLLRGGFRREYW
jgi:hypothetical protein